MAINFGLHEQQRPVDLLRSLGEVQQFRAQSDELARAEAAREAMQGAVNAQTGEIDPVGMRRAYVAGGDLAGLQRFEAGRADGARQQQELARANMTTLARMVDGVTDQASYTRARMAAMRMGVDTSHMPDAYSPEVVEDARMMLRGLTEPRQQPERYFEANDGDQYVVRGGRVERLFDDPTPKYLMSPDSGGFVAVPGTGGGAGIASPGGAQPPARGGGGDTLAMARDAIAKGAPREAVEARLRSMGIDPSALGGPTRAASGGFPS